MISSISARKSVLFLIVALCIFLMFWYWYTMGGGHAVYQKMRQLTIHNEGEADSCDIMSDNITISSISGLLERWAQSRLSACRTKEKRFRRLFHLATYHGHINMTEHMKTKMSRWLGGRKYLLSQANDQRVIYVKNKWTYSAVIVNIIRSNRPKSVSKSGLTDRQYVDKVTKEVVSCDFCNYKRNTASDMFGRVEGMHSFTASNVFKLDELHSLVVFRNHHPLDWEYVEFADSFATAKEWFRHAEKQHPDNVYPMIFWDLMPHAGSSQIHPHYHPILSKEPYYGYLNHLYEITQNYGKTNGASYFSDLVKTHQDLNLTVTWGEAVALSVVNPKKDYEFLLLAPDFGKDFVDLLYFVIRAYFEDLEKFCFSLAMALPPVGQHTGTSTGMPAVGRIITRGSVSSVHSDATSMELFASSLVDTDPWRAVDVLRESVKKRQHLVISTQQMSDVARREVQ